MSKNLNKVQLIGNLTRDPEYVRDDHGRFRKGFKQPVSAALLRRGEDHPLYGRSLSENTKKLLSMKKRGVPLGKSQWNWKGNKVGYGALHDWIRRYLVKPDVCGKCRKREPHEIANLSGRYRRLLADWMWMCRSCHRKYDVSWPRFRDEYGRFTRR